MYDVAVRRLLLWAFAVGCGGGGAPGEPIAVTVTDGSFHVPIDP
jgi:hypothetical protein